MGSSTENMNRAAATTLMTLSVSMRCSRDFRYYRSRSPRKADKVELIDLCRRLQSHSYSLHNLIIHFQYNPDHSHDPYRSNPEYLRNSPAPDDSHGYDVPGTPDQDAPHPPGGPRGSDAPDQPDQSGNLTLQPFLFLLGRSIHDDLETLHRELLFRNPDQLTDIIPRIDLERGFWKNYHHAELYSGELAARLDREIPAGFADLEKAIEALPPGYMD